jgi:hypothetical protein
MAEPRGADGSFCKNKIFAAAKGIYSFVEFLIYCNKFPAYALFPYVMFKKIALKR